MQQDHRRIRESALLAQDAIQVIASLRRQIHSADGARAVKALARGTSAPGVVAERTMTTLEQAIRRVGLEGLDEFAREQGDYGALWSSTADGATLLDLLAEWASKVRDRAQQFRDVGRPVTLNLYPQATRAGVELHDLAKSSLDAVARILDRVGELAPDRGELTAFLDGLDLERLSEGIRFEECKALERALAASADRLDLRPGEISFGKARREGVSKSSLYRRTGGKVGRDRTGARQLSDGSWVFDREKLRADLRRTGAAGLEM